MTSTKRRAPSEDAIKIEGASTAPIVFFDDVPAIRSGSGIGRIMLSAVVQDVDEQGRLGPRRVTVVHLRASPAALHRLRDAIDTIDLLNAPTDQARK